MNREDSVKRKGHQTNKDSFVDTVLQMLQEGLMVREINLRQVARRLGCAHTNAYNYFSSFEELLWWSLMEAMKRMVAMAEIPQLGNAHPDYSSGKNIIETYIRFALDHPAWYRLIWMEPLSGTPPQEVSDYLSVPGRILNGWLAGTITSPLPEEELHQRSRILHSFLHGELSKITTGRVTDNDEHVYISLIERTKRVYNMLFPPNTKNTL